MRTYRRAAGATVMAIIILLTVGCDQGSKALARSYLKEGNVVSLLGGLLVMRYVENQGAFLSLGALLPGPVRRAVFIAFPVAVMAGMIVYVVRKRNVRGALAAGLAFVAGGGAGNLLDRIIHDGRVGDFLNLGIGGIRTGIFNLADLSIMLGCVLLIVDSAGPRTGVPPKGDR